MKFLRNLIFPLIVFLSYSCKKEPDIKTKEIHIKKPIERLDSNDIDAFILKEKDFLSYRNKIIKFYSHRHFRLAWSFRGEFLPQASMYLNIIKNTDQDGFEVERFHNKNLWQLYRFATENNHRLIDQKKLRRDLDILFTGSFFKYAEAKWKGSIDPQKDEWYVTPKKIKYGKTLEAILSNKKSKDPFSEIEPLHQDYHKLKEVLINYLKIKSEGGWPSINLEGRKKISKGDTSTSVLYLRKRLAITKDLIGTYNNNDSIFDKNLEIAVKNFQIRHGLKPDGIVSGETLFDLNIPVEDKIRQLEINMERWRWVPEIISDKYIMVNIPEFVLHIYDKGKEISKMKVIVGKQASETPIFNDELEFIVINPNWNVPKDIAIKEILPLLQKDSSYLESMNMEAFIGEKSREAIFSDTVKWKKVNPQNFNFRFRQKPGMDNALGTIKFLFPNEYDVYLHDTPAHSLFNQSDRGFSHGCIRIEEPLELANFLLKDDHYWNEDKILDAIEIGEEKYIKLSQKIPVYIVYFTTWVDNEGHVHFQKDIYGHDKRLGNALFNL